MTHERVEVGRQGLREGLLFLDGHRAAAYALALASTALSALARWMLPAALTPAPYLGFYPAVVVSAALGGTGPGLFSTFASLLLVNFAFGRFNVHDHGALARQVIWVVASIGVSILAGSQRAARIQRDRFAKQRQLALDAARMGWWHYDPVTRMATYDQRCSEILGVPGQERPSEEILKRLHPADLPRVMSALEAALDPSDTRPYSAQYRVNRPDGSHRWVEAHGLPTFEGEGPGRHATSLVGTVVDITERKQAEDALRRHELVVQQSRDIILYMRREDGRIVEANAAAAAAYGYGRDELLALSIGDLRAPETRPLTQEQMAVADAQGIMFETVHRRRDGSTFPVEVSSRGATVDGIRMLVSVLRDITDRKRAEAALRDSEQRRAADALLASEQRYRTLFDSIDEGFCIVELRFDAANHPVDYRYLEVNKAFEKQTGLANAQGQWMRTLAPTHEETWFQIFGKIARTGEPARFENRADALNRWYDVYAFRVGEPRDRRVGILFNDITIRKREEEARESGRRKDEFLAMLSHELRNPLAPIRHASYVLRHAAPGSEETRRAHAVIERQTEHLTRLVDDLLDVTRIARGKIELRRSRVDLREVVIRAADDFRVLMDERGLALRIAVPASHVWVDADGTRVTQVVGNLLHNAAKFTRRGDEVALTLTAGDGAAEVHVKDTGAGIDPALLPRIFDAFVQGERTLARTEGGLGLGLALVKSITALHGGTVRVESGGKGKGAEFVIRLPMRADAPTPHEEGERAQARPEHRRVLVVDDNADAAESLADVIRMLGHVVEVAYDGPTAVEKARANPPNVVLCDIGLPGMNGYEVARALRGPGSNGVQIFAVTGYAQPEDVQRAIEAGFDGHLAKPCDPEQIERLLR
jgi:PAS domain S-box-containing protein